MDVKIRKGEMKETKAKSKKVIMITVAVVMAAGLGVGAYFGAKAIFESGIGEGRETAFSEVAEKVKELGKAISEKAGFQQKVEEIFGTIPEVTNTETIDGYVEKLNKLIEQTTDGSVKTLLTNYQKQWQDFKETYASQNNDAIAEGFNALKTVAAETAAQIKTAYDTTITEAVEDL